MGLEGSDGQASKAARGAAWAVAGGHCEAHYVLSTDARFAMTAFNTVRFRVRPGREQDFLDAHKRVQGEWPGLKQANIIKTGERSYCIIGRP
jgi:hypothetical protein